MVQREKKVNIWQWIDPQRDLHLLKIIYCVLSHFQPLVFFRELIIFFQVWYLVYIKVTVFMGWLFLLISRQIPCRVWFFLSLSLYSSLSLFKSVFPILTCGCIFIKRVCVYIYIYIYKINWFKYKYQTYIVIKKNFFFKSLYLWWKFC